MLTVLRAEVRIKELNGQFRFIPNTFYDGFTTVEEYKNELKDLQRELVKLQTWVQTQRKRVLIILEGRDTAGKGGAIRRFTRYLNPRAIRIVTLPKATECERGQWYFQRYLEHLPSAGEVVFFDRSWYNRAVLEPVMGFCSKEEHERFLRQVPELEYMLYEDGITVIKLWFSINIEEQKKRLEERTHNPLKNSGNSAPRTSRLKRSGTSSHAIRKRCLKEHIAIIVHGLS